MKVTLLGKVLVITAVGMMVPAFPANAIPSSESIPAVHLNGILKLESDFFDQGREQFEQEIERLLHLQGDADPPVLTIDESVQQDEELPDVLEEESTSPNDSLLLDSPER